MSWNIPGYHNIRDSGVRNILQSLSAWLSKPLFDNGIELGGGKTYNPASGGFTYTAPVNVFGGSGAPSAGLGVNGDFFFRSDTPGTANQRIYVKSAGAWVGIV